MKDALKGGILGVIEHLRSEVSQGDVQDHTDILDLSPGKVLENRNEIKQFVVVSVREPAADRNGVLRVENVRSWRIVNNDRVFQVTANL